MMRRHRTWLGIVLALAGVSWLASSSELARFQRRERGGDHWAGRAGTRQRSGQMDLTFMVTADTHFGFRGMAEKNAMLIDDMNALPGRAFPPGLDGVVGVPRGVLAAGDLTDNGSPEQWAAFVHHYGTDGTDGRLRFPVFETWGNHDKNHGWYVRHRINERHGSVVYAFDWHDLHIVSLGEAPDHADLAWLADDLTRVGREVGLILFLHFPLEGPYTDNWFTNEYKDALANVLHDHPVLGIFHGHYHASGTYRWRDHDVFNVGSPKHGFTSFAVVRVTDERMTVASWNYERKAWWWWHDKPIFGATGGVVRHVPRGMVGG